VSINRFFLSATLFALIIAQENEYTYSSIMDIPNLSFMEEVYCGLDILEQMDFEPIRGKSITVCISPGSVDRKGRHLLDVLQMQPDITIKYILVPEYGLFGKDDSRLKIIGDKIYDPVTGARIVDIFGRFVIPPKWALQDVDLILIDLPDSGVRYSTFMTSTTKIIEAAAPLDIPVLILDRPNPLGGIQIDGPIVRPAFQSFEGYHLVPIRHGLTVGEYILMINETGWAKDLARVNLTIIPMANWKRGMWQDNTHIPYIPSEPDIVSLEAHNAFVGMNLLKGTNLNIGHGTDKPFLRFGAPWISSDHVLEKLNSLELTGVEFTRIRYTPRMKQGATIVPLYQNEECSGLEITITDRLEFSPLATATGIIITINQLYPREFQWTGDGYIDKLFGHELLRTFSAQGKPANYLPPLWFHDVVRFNEFRQQFLLY